MTMPLQWSTSCWIICAVQPVKALRCSFQSMSRNSTSISSYRVVLRTPVRERHPSSVSKGFFAERILGLNMTISIMPMFTIMMLFQMPIMLAAMPTHPSRCARRVSINSRPIATSSFVAGSDFCPRKKGSFIISRTIFPPIFPQFPLRIRFREAVPPGHPLAATPSPCSRWGECR